MNFYRRVASAVCFAVFWLSGAVVSPITKVNDGNGVGRGTVYLEVRVPHD